MVMIFTSAASTSREIIIARLGKLIFEIKKGREFAYKIVLVKHWSVEFRALMRDFKVKA